MSLELWLAFVAASAILLAIPGPTILIVVSYALGHGRRAALSTVAGVALGDFTAMTCSMLGLGALLATSAMLFTALKWLGAAYLVWLGIKLWRAPPTLAAVEAGAGTGDETGGDVAGPALRPWRMFGHAYVVTALNPKSLVFFVAFLPQFLDLSAPLAPQMIVLEATFVTLAALNALAYALAASAARTQIRRPSVQRAVNRVGGTLLIGAGVAAVTWRGGA